MEEWIYKWRANGWINSAGREVVNRDLIEVADDLDTELKDLGRVRYCWVSRGENQEADELCNDILDGYDYDE